MNLLYTLTTYPPSTGGAQLHQHQLARTLSANHHVQVVSLWDSNRTDWLLGTTLRAPGQGHDYTIDGIDVHRIGLSRWDKLRIAPFVPLYYPLMDAALPPIAAILQHHLRDCPADLIHNVRIGREGLSYASLGEAHRRDVPFVLTPVHHPRWVGWRYRAYNRLYRLADAVLALTNIERQTLVSLGVRDARITVTGSGPNLADQAQPQAFRERYRIEGPLVLFVGQHYPYKGYRQLLEAARLIWSRIPDAQFVFIGPLVQEAEQVFALYPDPRIHRLGVVSLQDKTDALAACTLLCLPSTQESFGIVYTEAWYFGKPVIGCNIPPVAEVISDGVDGCLVRQESAAIADRIIELLLHPGLAERMGAAGQQKAAAQYTWAHVAERTEQAYGTALRM
ncbi:MAG: glycosyltransferase family 4 protein [Anaerolineae bacterium]|nr:glycosyltransferase family 4 protein [Anaerolineae bacterium]